MPVATRGAGEDETARGQRSPRPLRSIAGGSDAAFITTMIADATLCVDCLAGKAGMPPVKVHALLTTIGATLRLVVAPGRCEACLDWKTVARLAAPDDPAPREPRREEPARPLTTFGGVWQFLEAHRGTMFCTRCLAQALGETRRLDRAVIAAEGQGAQRRHATCASCGKPRLVCGLVSR